MYKKNCQSKSKMDFQTCLIDTKITLMEAYQKIHNIKGKCISNATYLKDYIESLSLTCKVVPVMNIYADDSNKRNIITVHMVVELDDGRMYDPSYEIDQHHGMYVKTIAEFNDWYNEAPNPIVDGLTHKEIVLNFLGFLKNAERINTKLGYVKKDMAYVKAQHKFSNFGTPCSLEYDNLT